MCTMIYLENCARCGMRVNRVNKIGYNGMNVFCSSECCAEYYKHGIKKTCNCGSKYYLAFNTERKHPEMCLECYRDKYIRPLLLPNKLTHIHTTLSVFIGDITIV